MSDRLESLYRTSLQAWNDNDWDAMEALYAPDAVVVAPAGWPESGEFRGWTAVRRQFERLKDVWDTEQAELLSIESSGDSVWTRVRWSGRSINGVPLDLELGQVAVYRGELIARLEFYLDAEEAARMARGGQEK